MYQDGVGFSGFKALPKEIYAHCIAKVNDTHVIMAGGRRSREDFDPASAEVFLLDLATEEWIQMPDMGIAR